MTRTQLRKRIQRQIEALSPGRLQVAADFLDYLVEREDNPATRELLSMPRMISKLRTAERQIEQGRYRSWREVQRGV